jgi:succinate-semialdehyde dehydrogenase/glutarate-semialdehyde dehydrogenase
MHFRSVNPYDGRLLNTYEGHSASTGYRKNQKHASGISLPGEIQALRTRSRHMHAAANELVRNKNDYAESITLEMGKTISESIAEVEKCAKVCGYYANARPGFSER